MSTAGTDERRTDTRQQIRAVALELFAEQGCKKTSPREIAERLGLTKAAVYYHYRTKEVLIAPDASAADLLRGRLALIVLHLGAFALDKLPAIRASAATPRSGWPWSSRRAEVLTDP